MKGYRKVVFKNKTYYVCRYKYRNESRLFIVDKKGYIRMKALNKSWYLHSNYVGTTDDVYLHNVVMEKEKGGGKGQKHTVDHISRNTHDNREVNLRIISQTEQNENQDKKERTTTLPKNCGVKVDEIPKGVWFDKDRERFIIELKKNSESVLIEKQSGSKEISMKAKLERVKKRLIDIHDEHPEIVETKHLLENYSEEAIKLMKEFNKIITLSGYKCSKNNLMKIPKRKILELDIDGLSDSEKAYVLSDVKQTAGRNAISKLPAKCGILPSDIPKHCYYTPATDKRGDAFVIDRHPKLPTGKRQWKTTGAKAISTMDKFKSLKKTIKELENGTFKPIVVAKKKNTLKKNTNGGSKTSKPQKKLNPPKKTNVVKKDTLKKKPNGSRKTTKISKK